MAKLDLPGLNGWECKGIAYLQPWRLQVRIPARENQFNKTKKNTNGIPDSKKVHLSTRKKDVWVGIKSIIIIIK